MAEIKVSVRAERHPELHKIIEWLKRARISQATALDNALYTRYFVEALEDEQAEQAELLRAISNVRISLQEQITELDRKEARLTNLKPSSQTVPSKWTLNPAPRAAPQTGEPSEDNVQEDCF